MSTKRKYTSSSTSRKKARTSFTTPSGLVVKGYPGPAPRFRSASAKRIMNARTGGFLGLETKFYDTSSEVSLTSSTDASGGECDPATILCISAPAQGDGEQNRDGNRMIIKSVFVNGMIDVPPQADQTAADIACCYMVALVLDTQTNGAQLNSEDVYVNPSGSALLAAQPLRNLQYSSRFRVLATATGYIDQPNIAYDGTNMEQGGSRRPFVLNWTGNLPVQFKGGATAAGVAGVADNSLHIIAFTSTTGLQPALRYNSRIRFQG